MALTPASTDKNRKKQLSERQSGGGNWNTQGAPKRTPQQEQRTPAGTKK